MQSCQIYPSESHFLGTLVCYVFCSPMQVFLEMVPRFLGMSPLVDDSDGTTEVNGVRERRRSSFGLMQRAEEYVLKQPRSEMMFDKQRERHGLTRSIGKSTVFKKHDLTLNSDQSLGPNLIRGYSDCHSLQVNKSLPCDHKACSSGICCALVLSMSSELGVCITNVLHVNTHLFPDGCLT